MKRTIFLLIFLIVFQKTQAQNSEVTTYYFIRHAEKVRTDKTNKNPSLTEKGLLRSQNWSTVFSNIKFDEIYSTNYLRTVQTASPTAQIQGVAIKFYDSKKLFSKDFQRKTKGKTVLIIGHSNTTPAFVNKVLGYEKYKDIADGNNSNLYIVTIINNVKRDIMLKINH